jgi:hypothetical protein
MYTIDQAIHWSSSSAIYVTPSVTPSVTPAGSDDEDDPVVEDFITQAVGQSSALEGNFPAFEPYRDPFMDTLESDINLAVTRC